MAMTLKNRVNRSYRSTGAFVTSHPEDFDEDTRNKLYRLDTYRRGMLFPDGTVFAIERYEVDPYAFKRDMLTMADKFEQLEGGSLNGKASTGQYTARVESCSFEPSPPYPLERVSGGFTVPVPAEVCVGS